MEKKKKYIMLHRCRGKFQLGKGAICTWVMCRNVDMIFVEAVFVCFVF